MCNQLQQFRCGESLLVGRERWLNYSLFPAVSIGHLVACKIGSQQPFHRQGGERKMCSVPEM